MMFETHSVVRRQVQHSISSGLTSKKGASPKPCDLVECPSCSARSPAEGVYMMEVNIMKINYYFPKMRNETNT
jgi:hypothetical protein